MNTQKEKSAEILCKKKEEDFNPLKISWYLDQTISDTSTIFDSRNFCWHYTENVNLFNLFFRLLFQIPPPPPHLFLISSSIIFKCTTPIMTSISRPGIGLEVGHDYRSGTMFDDDQNVYLTLILAHSVNNI